MRILVTDCPVLPIGEYIARVVSVSPVYGRYGRQFHWAFVIISPDEAEGTPLLGNTDLSSKESSTFAQWAGACLGRLVHYGEEIDTDDLIGKAVTLTVSIIVVEGGEVNRIDDVRPYSDDATFSLPA